ncbi:TetR/AcrR family transcriptional regulator [Rhizobium rhizoryzae]|uniref:TetR/AcrR family transcriptional regulator n=1 Tax=Rhizobium rhizoryzae TaxID=451876 RepID=UPI0035E3F69F
MAIEGFIASACACVPHAYEYGDDNGQRFRAYSNENWELAVGASLAVISNATGLGKGSLYHLFPNGKEEMVRVVLAEIEQWFQEAVYSPLRDGTDANTAIAAMLDEGVSVSSVRWP